METDNHMKERMTNRIKRELAGVDWQLLVFFLLFLNVKLVVKLAGICFLYFRRRDVSFGFSLRKSRLPIFYPAMIGIALLNYVLKGLFSNANYALLLLTGIGFWVLCILALHQVKQVVDRNNIEQTENTLLLFFVINAAASFINLFAIMLETGVLNPYRYQGMYQKYFIGTGDYIRGISFDTSTTNAVISAFGVLFFLYRKRFALSLLCMAVLLLTCSNFTVVLLVACLAGLFLFRTNSDQKSIIVVQLVFVGLFMTNISPHNNNYTVQIARKFFGPGTRHSKAVAEPGAKQRPDSLLTTDEKNYLFAKRYVDSIGTIRAQQALALPGDERSDALLVIRKDLHKLNIHTPEYQHRPDSSETRLQAIAYLQNLRERAGNTDTISKIVPGKITAYKQLVHFFAKHPSGTITGEGLGNFSSKMAFRASGLRIAGGYPAGWVYTSEEFEKNHLSVYLTHFGKDSIYHSIANSPNSFYLQLLGEYGLLGAYFFLFGYLRFFTRSFRKLSYGLPVLFIMLGAFLVEYWFEQLSVVVLFELLMLLDIKTLAREELPT